jgi:hypothetical protein
MGSLQLSESLKSSETAQLGALAVLPFMGLYVSGELNLINLGDASNLLIVAAALLVVDVLLFFVSRATFRREEILTKWK